MSEYNWFICFCKQTDKYPIYMSNSKTEMLKLLSLRGITEKDVLIVQSTHLPENIRINPQYDIYYVDKFRFIEMKYFTNVVEYK